MFILKSKHESIVIQLQKDVQLLRRDYRAAEERADRAHAALKSERESRQADKYQDQRRELARELLLGGHDARSALEHAAVIYPVPA